MRVNIIEKYNKLSVPLKASLWFALCNIVQKGIQFITVPLFTRMLSTFEYGQYSIYTSWISILGIFTSLDLYMAVFNNGMIKYKNDRLGYISAMQGLSSLSTLICFIIVIISKNFLQRLIGLPISVIEIMFIELFFSPALQYWTMRQRYEYRYKALVLVTIAIAIVNPVVGLLFVYHAQHKGIARIVSVVLVNSLVGLIFYIYNYATGRKVFNRQYWHFAFFFNLPLIPHYLSSILLSSSDRVMIQNMVGEEKVAIYSVAYSISMIMNIFVSAFNASFAPYTYQECEKHNYSSIRKADNMLMIFMAFLVLVPVILAPEVVAIMGPPEYQEAIWVIPPVSLSVMFIFIYGNYANVELFFERRKFVMIASVLAAISNIVLNYIFIPIFGYVAAGYTTLACYIILAVGHYYFYVMVCKENNIDSKSIFNSKLIILISVGLSVITFTLMNLYRFPIIRYAIVILVFIIIFYQRKKIITLLRRIKNKS